MSTRSMRLPIVLLYSRIQNSSARIVQVVRFLLDNIMPRVLERSISSGDDCCRVIWCCSWVMDDGLIKWRVERLDGSVRLRLVYEHNFTPENCSISYGKTLFDIFDVCLYDPFPVDLPVVMCLFAQDPFQRCRSNLGHGGC